MTWTRPRDKHGRALYAPNEVPPASEAFAHWRGLLTHPSAVHTPPVESVSRYRSHAYLCVGGWIPSGEWWLHCGVCRPERDS